MSKVKSGIKYTTCYWLSFIFMVLPGKVDRKAIQILFEPAHEIMVLITSATSEGSDKPAYLRSLARAFAVCTHEVWK